MGVAASNRGNKLIRQQIDDEKIISISREYVSKLESQGERYAEKFEAQAQEIADLKKKLERTEMFLKLRAAERNMAYEERDAAIKTSQTWKELAHNFEKKHKKCSAILNLIRQYVGREQFENYHTEAKHDYPHLWPDVERDAYGWPVTPKTRDE